MNSIQTLFNKFTNREQSKVDEDNKDKNKDIEEKNNDIDNKSKPNTQ